MVDRDDILGLCRTFESITGKKIMIQLGTGSITFAGRTLYRGYGDIDACARALYGLCKAMACAKGLI